MKSEDTKGEGWVNDDPETASKAFEKILNKCGDFGLYQWKLMIITSFCGFFTSFHNLGGVFLAATPGYYCSLPHLQNKTFTEMQTIVNMSVPWTIGKKGVLEPSKCLYYHNGSGTEALDATKDAADINRDFWQSNNDYIAVAANSSKCSSWTYDQTTFQSTIVTEWNLVCDKRWLIPTIQSTYMVGILVGAVTFSLLSDKIGRRPTSLIGSFIFFTAAMVAPFSSSLVLLLIVRFILAAAGQGVFLVNFIIMTECVNLKGRNVFGSLFHMCFGIGFLSLCAIAFWIREWRALHFTISFPIILLSSYYWWLPESPRWLLMGGREEKGLRILKTIARTNKNNFPSNDEVRPLLDVISREVHIDNNESMNITEKFKSIIKCMSVLLKTRNMRRRNLITWYTWFVTSTMYYGLSFNSANINATLYVSVALTALVEPVAYIATIFLLTYFGRRGVLSSHFIIGGAACVLIVFLPPDEVGWNLVLSSIGKFAVSVCFPIVFLLSAELVPTHVRNISIGIASMCARVGSVLSPYIVDLLGDVYFAIPSTLFGVMSLLAGGLCLMLPETGNKRLPESVEEIESMIR